jgi:hypothetical protein
VAQLAGGVAGLLALAVLLALVAPSLLAPDPPDGVLVNEVEAGNDGRFSEDLRNPVNVTNLAGTELRLKVLGIPLPGQKEPVVDRAATVDVGTFAELLAGPVRFTVTGGQQDPLVVEPAGGGLGGVIRYLPLLPLLFAGAYTESLLRGIRRRHAARRADLVAMAGVGAVAGLGLVLASWTLGKQDLDLPLVLAVVVLCAGAGALVAVLQAERIRGQVRAVRDPAASP